MPCAAYPARITLPATSEGALRSLIKWKPRAVPFLSVSFRGRVVACATATLDDDGRRSELTGFLVVLCSITVLYYSIGIFGSFVSDFSDSLD